MGREDQIIKERLRKLKELREIGINPYPDKFDKKQTIRVGCKNRVEWCL